MSEAQLSIEKLGKLSGATVKRLKIYNQIVDITGLDEENVRNQINNSHGNLLISNIFAANWPGDDKQLSKPWINFFNKFSEIDTIKVSKWKELHQLAYICRRYENHYKEKFVFSLQRAPLKCPEMVLVKKMCAMLGTTNARTIREYIDWIYDVKIIPNNMKIRSLAFFMTPGLGNEFFIQRVEKNKIDKTTELPNEYKEVVDALGLPVFTYGDLAFAKCALEEAPNSESRAPYRQLFDKLVAIGFDPLVLKDLR